MSTHAGAPAPAARFRNALAASLALALLAACNRAPAPAETPAPAPPEAAAADGSIHPDQWPEVQWPLAADPALEKKVDDLLATLTLEEKVGQLIQGDIGSLTPEDVRKYRLGSILARGGSAPGGQENGPLPDCALPQRPPLVALRNKTMRGPV